MAINISKVLVEHLKSSILDLIDLCIRETETTKRERGENKRSEKNLCV